MFYVFKTSGIDSPYFEGKKKIKSKSPDFYDKIQ